MKRPPLLLPERMKELLEDKHFLHAKDDRPMLCDLYRDAFDAFCASTRKLDYVGCDFGDVDVGPLVPVHVHAPSCSMRMCRPSQ